MSQLIELRPEVLAFARQMEQRLRDHDADKRGVASWKTASEGDLIVHAISKGMQLEQAVRCGFVSRNRHAVDLANYCMMIADVAGALQSIPTPIDHICIRNAGGTKLPEGKSCGQCMHYGGCVKLFGCASDNRMCDWHPSRFNDAPKVESLINKVERY